MKIGFVSRIGEFPEACWESEFDLVRKCDLNYLELIVNYPFFGPLSCTPNEIRKLKNLAKNYNVDLVLHLLPNQCSEEFDIASLDRRIKGFSMDEIWRTLNIAKLLGAKLITIHGGKFDPNKDYKTYLKSARETLEKVNLDFKEVKLCVENLPVKDHFGKSPNELPIYTNDLLYLVDGLNNVGICFDVGHANTVGNPLEFYEQLKKTGKIWDMHIHDNNGYRDDHLLFGKGSIDFKKFLDVLKQDKYKGYISIELDTWSKVPESVERVKALEYLKNL